MTHMKRFLSLILVCSFVISFLSMPVTAESNSPFTDIENHWSESYAQWAYEQKLMTGVSETKFSPDTSLTRAMAATILYRLSGETVTNNTAPFSDVKAGLYYTDAVCWASQNGIVNGVSNTRFAPASTIQLKDFVTMLYRYELYLNPDQEPVSSKWSYYYSPAMDWCVNFSIVQGDEIGRINVKKEVTRGEVAAMLMRYAEKDTYVDDGVLYDIDPQTVDMIFLRRSEPFRIIEDEQEIKDFCEKLNGYRYSGKSYLPPMEGWDNFMTLYLKDGTNVTPAEISSNCIIIGSIIYHNAEPSNGNQNSYFTDDWFAEWFPRLSWE